MPVAVGCRTQFLELDELSRVGVRVVLVGLMRKYNKAELFHFFTTSTVVDIVAVSTCVKNRSPCLEDDTENQKMRNLHGSHCYDSLFSTSTRTSTVPHACPCGETWDVLTG